MIICLPGFVRVVFEDPPRILKEEAPFWAFDRSSPRRLFSVLDAQRESRVMLLCPSTWTVR